MNEKKTFILPISYKCRRHPRYGGQRRPRTNCKECHELWEHSQAVRRNIRIDEEVQKSHEKAVMARKSS